ncbi:hypothetical protein T440DRAFT_469749 [Plenodomus tracheiphilus IPT5]|uniref:Uncharacterized protein n=1 Tax=Plenodomus tracheiphilus IPT5 TaxID=1408161 RepID=A0A6A7B0E2_9PLEO|nr:hypothetical protein T440DRAFT_469749 [Plenodomus tracheiphilus IPT5]
MFETKTATVLYGRDALLVYCSCGTAVPSLSICFRKYFRRSGVFSAPPYPKVLQNDWLPF